MKILIIGYGNPCRGDDGVGPALIEKIEAEKLGSEDGLAGVTTDSDYQLNIEYAVDFAKHDIVVMVDASVKGAEPFEFGPVKPSHDVACTTHSVSPGSLMGLTLDVADTPPDGYLLAIRGYDFELGESLTSQAVENLTAAYEFIEVFISENRNP